MLRLSGDAYPSGTEMFKYVDTEADSTPLVRDLGPVSCRLLSG